MNTINHALWGAVIGEMVGNPVGGAFMGAMPDLLTIPGFAVYKFRGIEPEKSPKRLRDWYELVHNWWVAGALVGILFLISPKCGVIGLAYFWHVVEDAFLHTKMATRFLYPVWRGRIQKVSVAEQTWIQVVDFVMMMVVAYVVWRSFGR